MFALDGENELTAHSLFRVRPIRLAVPLFIPIGIYNDIMITGHAASDAQNAFETAIEPALPLIAKMPLNLLVPVSLMLLLPLAAAFAASRIARRHAVAGNAPLLKKEGNHAI
jgi:hypothetical protein